jgi:hypothetical protein
MSEEHVETKRLFFAAAGEITLDGAEDWHRHACEECRELYRIFLRLISLEGKHPQQIPPSARWRGIG